LSLALRVIAPALLVITYGGCSAPTSSNSLHGVVLSKETSALNDALNIGDKPVVSSADESKTRVYSHDFGVVPVDSKQSTAFTLVNDSDFRKKVVEIHTVLVQRKTWNQLLGLA
jgi:hypothetical protein